MKLHCRYPVPLVSTRILVETFQIFTWKGTCRVNFFFHMNGLQEDSFWHRNGKCLRNVSEMVYCQPMLQRWTFSLIVEREKINGVLENNSEMSLAPLKEMSMWTCCQRDISHFPGTLPFTKWHNFQMKWFTETGLKETFFCLKHIYKSQRQRSEHGTADSRQSRLKISHQFLRKLILRNNFFDSSNTSKH